MKNYKLINHREYLTMRIPDDWVYDDSEEVVSIYHPHGFGAITISFYTLENDIRGEIDTFVSTTAVRFARQSNYRIDGAFVHNVNKGVIYASGKTNDDWYVKLWLIIKWPRFLIGTYLSSQVNKKEIEKATEIMESVAYKE